MDGMDGLNPAQRAAVTSPSAVLQVLAPPGSGKTKTLTARVAYQIVHDGLNPSNIIVCTFTIKAAREMQNRIQNFLGPDLAGRLILGTFHSIARRLLAIHGKHLGLDQKFGIADASDSKSIVARIIKRKGVTTNPGTARHRISGFKANGVTALQHAASTAKSKKASTDTQEIDIIYTEYQEHLETSNLLDYDDLLLKCADLLRSYPRCLENIQAVLIDEFQDTNNVQYDLMMLFAQHKQVISIVGDPDQSIYGWRSAKIENLVRMQAHFPDTHVVNLEENYRSSSCILLAAQELIEQDNNRLQKSLSPTHSAGERPTLRHLCSAANEAEWIVSEIQRAAALTGGLLKWKDFAVLLRSASLSRLIESSLGKVGIPYRMVGGHRFFDRLEVKLVLDYLRVLANLDHSEAMARVLNVPSRKIGDVSIGHLLEEANERGSTLWSLVLGLARGEMKPTRDVSRSACKGLELFVDLVITTQKKLLEDSDLSLADFVEYLVKKLQLKAWLSKIHPEKEDNATRWANIQELIAQAAEASASPLREDGVFDEEPLGHRLNADIQATNNNRQEDLTHFLTNIALSTETTKNEDEAGWQGHVTLSTCHAAKGLEWPAVFIPAAYEGSIPHSRAEDHDEERRLMYVAMTRAQSLLYVSCPEKNSMRGDTTLSPFLTTEVRACFAERGPSFTYDLVKELAKILRREGEPLNIEGGRKDVQYLEDDQTRFNPKSRQQTGDDDDLEILYDDEEQSYGKPLKRQWIGNHNDDSAPLKKRDSRALSTSFMTATTLQKTKQYSIATAAYSTSFVSANSLPQPQESNKENIPAYKHSQLPGCAQPSETNASKGKGTRKGKAASDQRNIRMFFAAKPVTTESKTLTYATRDNASCAANDAQANTSSTSTTLAPNDTEKAPLSVVKPAKLFNASMDSLNNTQPKRRPTYGVRMSQNGWAARKSRPK